MEWTQALKHSIAYMETNLLKWELCADLVAEEVHMSSFYFQKGFAIMTGYNVGEYIRNRRLYLAALDILADNEKIIDIAYQYGYDTPEGFTKAFSRFHGISPNQLKGNPSKIKPFLPLTIQVTVRGGNEMDVVIEKMDSFQLIGFERMFSFDSAYAMIPEFWTEFRKKYRFHSCPGDVQKAVYDYSIGECGCSIDDLVCGKDFHYMIAGRYESKSTPESRKEQYDSESMKERNIPEGMKVKDIPAHEWAKFRAVGPMPGALQAINTSIFREWLPGNSEYEIADGFSLEWYSQGDTQAKDYESAIWIPVRRINKISLI